MNPTKSTCDDSRLQTDDVIRMQPDDVFRLQPDDIFRLQPCEDGSLTVHSALHDQCFHSSAGAILESRYIYLELGLKAYLSARQNAALQNAARREQADETDLNEQAGETSRREQANGVSILEIGFGSGINALLCAIEFENARRNRICCNKAQTDLNNATSNCENATSNLNNALAFPEEIYFESIELYPIPEEIWSQLDYASLLAASDSERDHRINIDRNQIKAIFEKIHRAPWNQVCEILPGFKLHKRHEDILTFMPAAQYQVVFFDAFSPDCQPELWSKEVFAKIKEKLLPGAVMSTYSSKGFVKQHLRDLGFEVCRKPGPGHKRHVLQAISH
ncbi:MAG: hypothetical protein IJ280_00935 [Bacteroidales bacterium]|nr:hypothetical protein [Bacteroidales bacterium]